MKTSRRHTQPNPNIIKNWLSEHGDPAITKLVERNFAIADKIKSILDSKGIKPVQFAELMDKDKSEISKWLSGQHNFTIQTITKIEIVLEEDIIHIEPKERIVYFTKVINNIKGLHTDFEYKEFELVYG